MRGVLSDLAVFLHERVFRRPHDRGRELAWLMKTAREKMPFPIDEWSGVRKRVSPYLSSFGSSSRVRQTNNAFSRICTGDQRCRRLKIGSILTDLIKC
jgi:hypothetical protein